MGSGSRTPPSPRGAGRRRRAPARRRGWSLRCGVRGRLGLTSGTADGSSTADTVVAVPGPAPARAPGSSSADAVSVSGGSTEAWSMSEVWSEVASAVPVIDWVMMASCWAIAVACESSERMLAATEASIGAATLALAATAPLIGAARSASRSTLTSTLSRSPFSRSPVSSCPTVSVTSSTMSPDGADDVARRVEDLAGERVEGADHVAGGVHDVAGRPVEGADDVAGRVEHGGAVDQVGDRAEHVPDRVERPGRSAGPAPRRRCRRRRPRSRWPRRGHR